MAVLCFYLSRHTQMACKHYVTQSGWSYEVSESESHKGNFNKQQLGKKAGAKNTLGQTTSKQGGGNQSETRTNGPIIIYACSLRLLRDQYCQGSLYCGYLLSGGTRSVIGFMYCPSKCRVRATMASSRSTVAASGAFVSFLRDKPPEMLVPASKPSEKIVVTRLARLQ